MRWHEPRLQLRGSAVVALVAFLTLAVAACDFEVDDPTAITAGDLRSSSAMTGLMVGAVRSYDDSFDRNVMFSALVADEMIASGSWITWHEASKQGTIDPDAYEGDHVNIPWRSWRELQRARGDADEAVEWMEEVLDDADSDLRYAQVNLYAGMSYVNFGELFCEVAFDGGPKEPISEAFAQAKVRLEQALTTVARATDAPIAGSPNTATSGKTVGHMAHLLLARVAMEEGNYAEAIAHAGQVPHGFQWVAHYPAGQGSSGWFHWMSRGESTVQETFRNTGDPRVVVVESNVTGPDTETRLWFQQKYPLENMNWIVGKWQEARLIEAEARLASQGAVASAVALMNQVRAEWDELEPFDPGISEQEAWANLRLETKYELWLEMRRMVYMRRWNEFPSGWATCFPIPDEEVRTNPNL